MKRFIVLAFLPIVLFALEKVNLIRNASFEREDEAWIVETGAASEPNPAEGNKHNDTKSIDGFYSATADTREIPSWQDMYWEDSVAIRQEFPVSKKLKDLDSLTWHHSIVPRFTDPESSTRCIVGLTYAEPEGNGVCYGFIGFGNGVDNWLDITEMITDDTSWHYYEKGVYEDFVNQLRVDENQELASFVLAGWGVWINVNTWRGQITYWDDIRLMGWADYDISLTRVSGSLEQPAAMVWNNGREDQTDVKVIATIEGGIEPYADTVIISNLSSDDSTEVVFEEFGPISPTNDYYLTIVTGNFADMLDECDENDMLYEEYLDITESPVLDEINLDVQSLVSAPSFHVTYSLPSGKSGILTLYDATGRRIQRNNVTGSGSAEFSVSLASGVYLVRLESNQRTLVRKAVILSD